ncbi:MAG: flagellar export protein FliJ [Lachnospiraceae bacterium]|nr:flagellar export protein FliJ [Lachnospiraceae bacterium]
MAKFKYRMQNILELKEKLESQQKIAFSLAMAKVREEEDKLRQLLLRRGEYEKRLKEAEEGILDLKEIAHLKTAISTMKTLIRDQMFAIKKANEALEAERRKLDDLMKDRKTHEKLREKAFDEFLKEVSYEDMKVTDEFTGFKYSKR